jgi:Cu2+-exporting ATPase
MNHESHQTHDQHANHEHEHAAHDKHAGHSPEMFRNRFWLSLALTVPVLYFSVQIQSWFGYTAVTFPGATLINPVLGTVLFFYGGWPFLVGALREIRARQLGMMTLISLAISVAYLYSMAVVLGLVGKPFFWELATLIVIMLLGHWIEMASVQSASKALEHLASLVPHQAHKMVGDQLQDVPVSDLRHGDTVLIRPGEQIPIDGEVTDGQSSVNEAFLTGESRPVTKARGDEVVAGSVNGEGALTVEVTRTGDETTLSQIQRLVEEAQSSRSRFQNLADRAAGWLFYIATATGAVTLVVWLIASDDLQFAIARTVAVLVIACPHALGLAIPLVTVNATTMSARNGILVRNREGFERARNLKIVAFDKTGTLTEGAFGVRAITTNGLSGSKALTLAAALEQRSEHPLAAAIVEEAKQRNVNPSPVEQFEVIAGQGVTGRVDNQRYWLGRAEWLTEQGIDLNNELQQGLAEAEGRGESVIVLFDDTRGLAVFALADRIRESGRRAVAQLNRLGIETVMITGDADSVAKTVAAELGIDRYFARVLPQDKARIIQELKQKGPAAFVGDGINDAPALLEANLGIAIGAGTNVAIESADLVLIDNDPLDVLAALKLSKATYGKMIQNLLWATGYNVIAIPLAAGAAVAWGILLSPAIGALFMSLSTVIVAVNAMLLRRVNLAPVDSPRHR